MSLQGGSLSTHPYSTDRQEPERLRVFCLPSLGLPRWVEGDASQTVGSVLLSSCVITCENSARGGRCSYSASWTGGAHSKSLEARPC